MKDYLWMNRRTNLQPQNETEALPVKISLAWLLEQKAVPVCGGNFSGEYRAIHSLTASRAERMAMPDGSIQIQVPAGRWIAQFLAVISAGVGLAAACFAPVGLVRQSLAGMWPMLIIGGLIGALASRWLIRRHPAVMLISHPGEGTVVADNGRLRIAKADIKRLVLFTGRGAITLPAHPGATGNDWAMDYGVLLVQRMSAPADEAEMVFRYALPKSAMSKAARLAAEMLGVPLQALPPPRD